MPNWAELKVGLYRVLLTQRPFGIGCENAGQLGRRSGRELGDLRGRCLNEADKLGAQFVERGHRGECLDPIGIQNLRTHRAADNFELVIGLGELNHSLGGCDRIR